MKLTDEELAKRLPLWEALSDLFLDTELNKRDHRHIAQKMIESNYSEQEISEILYGEVFRHALAICVVLQGYGAVLTGCG